MDLRLHLLPECEGAQFSKIKWEIRHVLSLQQVSTPCAMSYQAIADDRPGNAPSAGLIKTIPARIFHYHPQLLLCNSSLRHSEISDHSDQSK